MMKESGMETGGRLGFGCMRLPLLNRDTPDAFDYPRIEALFDAFLARGFRYFDTAYTYHGYRAEEAVRRALVERHPRGAFELATKLPLRDFKDAADMSRIFEAQLAACGVTYFDYYLLHNMGHNVYAKCETHGAFDFLARVKAEGRARFVGMSFHDTPALLEEILEKYGRALDFLQLQINYADWEQPNVESRRCLEIARRYEKPVIVMEPCKGGTLTNLPDAALRRMEAAAPDASAASWAFRFAASQKGVLRVLSGMNEMAQVEENTAIFREFRPLSEAEYAALDEARAILEADAAIPCTACGYCVDGCPKHIAIPRYFALYNSLKRTTGSFSSQPVYYNNLVRGGHGRAGDCVRCGRCEAACPQHLPIRAHLEAVGEVFDRAAFPAPPKGR